MLSKLNTRTMESQLLIEETFSMYSNVINNVMNHDVAKWYLRQNLWIRTSIFIHECRCPSNELQHFAFLYIPLSYKRIVSLCLSWECQANSLWFHSRCRCTHACRCDCTQWVSPVGSVLEYRPTACGGLILLSPSFFPFLLARTRNYSSLSYFLSSFHSFPPAFFVILS